MDRLVQSETVPGPSEDCARPARAQAAEVAAAFLTRTGTAQKTNAHKVFAELARRTLERTAKGQDAVFTAVMLRAGVAPGAAKEPSAWISPLWSKLLELEPGWQEGLAETARQLGSRFVPRLDKQPGSPALYSIKAVPVSEAQPDQAVAVASVPDGGLRYLPESVRAPAAWLSATLKSGIVRWTVGMRWAVLGSLLLASLVVAVILYGSFTIGLRSTRPLSLADVLGVLAVVGMAVWLIGMYRFLGNLFDLRIVMAPTLLTPLRHSDDVTLEVRRRDDSDKAGELAFVRYTGVCPQCGGTVTVSAGRREFPDRLIGRCAQSGREHVYTFDHVLKVGRPLR